MKSDTPPRILFDASIIGYSLLRTQYRTGIYRVAVALVRELGSRPDVRLSLYSSSGNYLLCKRALAGLGLKGLRFYGAPLASGLCFSFLIARNLLSRLAGKLPPPLRALPSPFISLFSLLHLGLNGLRSACERPGLAGFDAYFSPMEAAPRSIQAAPLRVCYLIHDLIPLVLPDYRIDPADRTKWFPRLIEAIRPVDLLCTVSEFTRRDYLRLFPHFPPGRIGTIFNAVDESLFRPCLDQALLAAVRAKYGIPPADGYFLTVSTVEPRKRLDALLAAFGLLHAQAPGACLVLCGSNRLRHRQVVLQAIPSELRPFVVFTGFVADADLSPLYSGCRAFVYLSEYEGFGLPVLEAMACGAPVIVADRTSLPELAGPAGLLVDPDDAGGVARVMRELFDDAGLREARSRLSLARAKQFSWTNTVDALLSVLQHDR